MGESRNGSHHRGEADPIEAANVARTAPPEDVKSMPTVYLDEKAMEFKLLLDHPENLVVPTPTTRGRLHPAPALLRDPNGAVDRPAPCPGWRRYPRFLGPLDRNRLGRGGDRQLNCDPHRIAVTHGRCIPTHVVFLPRKQLEGMSKNEACTTRRAKSGDFWSILRWIDP
jgi:hypothetical protein